MKSTVLLCCKSPVNLAAAHNFALSNGMTSLPLAPGDWRRGDLIARELGLETVLTDCPGDIAFASLTNTLGPETWKRARLCALDAWPEKAAIMLTGGSSGMPKPIVKTARAIQGEAQVLATLFGNEIPPLKRIVSTVPPEHMFGYMFGFWLPQLTGTDIPKERIFLPADLRTACTADDQPAWIVTTPTHLRSYVRAERSFGNISGIICATSPLSNSLAQAACRLFGALILEIYGATETGAIAYRLRRRGDEESPLWTPLPGTWAEPLQNGTTRWHQPYSQAVTEIADSIALEEDGRFELLGRPDDEVKVAGKRQSLSGLNRILMSLPGVRDGAFVQMDEKERLAALVVLEKGYSIDSILDDLSKLIDPVFLPRPVYMVKCLPRSDVGKLRREDLLTLISQA